MIYSEEPNYGLVLTIMEWHRLSTNGVVRIGDRIRKVGKYSDIGELINLAPDLGESIDDYVFARLLADPKIYTRTISQDNPHLRLLCLHDVSSFHVMTQSALPNLQDRAQSYGVVLQDPMFDDSQFGLWQKDARERALAYHANRIKSEFNLPTANRDCLNLVSSALQKTIEVRVSTGTPAYGWAVAFKSAINGNEAFKGRFTSVLQDMQKIPFSDVTFFSFDVNEVRVLAEELQGEPRQKTAVPLAGMAWIHQIGHQHYRDQAPTSEAFSKSIVWLKGEIGEDWTASLLEVYCFAAVKLDRLPQLAWPTAVDLARMVTFEISTVTLNEQRTDALHNQETSDTGNEEQDLRELTDCNPIPTGCEIGPNDGFLTDVGITSTVTSAVSIPKPEQADSHPPEVDTSLI